MYPIKLHILETFIMYLFNCDITDVYFLAVLVKHNVPMELYIDVFAIMLIHFFLFAK